jgi:hypothetical protein
MDAARNPGPVPVEQGGMKFDKEKPMLDLLDPKVMNEMGKVLTIGAKKYGKYNWKKGLTSTRTTAAALRHIFAYLDGEDIDADTGCYHLGCALVELMFTLNGALTRNDLDDRFRKESK